MKKFFLKKVKSYFYILKKDLYHEKYMKIFLKAKLKNRVFA